MVWPAALIGMASVIDNPWSVCTQRSLLAGRQLAEVLLSRQQVCVICDVTGVTVIDSSRSMFIKVESVINLVSVLTEIVVINASDLSEFQLKRSCKQPTTCILVPAIYL